MKPTPNNINTTPIYINIKQEDLTEAEKVFNEEGLTLSEGITKFIIHVKQAGCYPWVVKDDFYSNPETIEAIKEAEEILKDPNRKGYHSAEELHAAILAEEND